MALKTNFEATSDIASPFVDEIANPGGTGSAGLDNARAAIDREMNAQRISNNADEEMKRQANPAATPAPKKPVVDKRNTGQKMMDKNQKFQDALPAHLRNK